MAESEETGKKSVQETDPDEMVDIQDMGNSILRRIAGIIPEKNPTRVLYRKYQLDDTKKYVQKRSAKVQHMVNDTERVYNNMHRIKEDMDELDREIAQIQEDNWRRQAQRKYTAHRQPADFVMYDSDKYSLQDFLPRSHFHKK